jgi:gliding motility-associated lipoprotein GldK
MRKLFLSSIALVFLLTSCGSKSKSKGELVGVRGKKWHPEKPYGMELIPRGAFVMGKAEEDQAKVLNAPTRTVTVRSFYMDDTEITNSEYRQFVEWVKDSIVRTKLAILAD